MTTATKRVRSVLSALVSFIMSLLITGGVLCTTLYMTALNDDFAVSVVERSQYAELLSAEIKDEFISYGHASNIEDTFFDSLFENTVTPQRISTDTEQILRDFYAGSVQDSVPTDDLEAVLFEDLKEYAIQRGFEPDDEMVENLQIVASELCEVYNSYVSVFSLSYFRTASRMLSNYSPYALYAAVICAVGFVVTAVILRLFYRKAKNYLRYYIYAFSGAALMLLAAPLAALIGDIGGKINIASAALYSMASGMLSSVFVAVAVSAAIPILCTVLLSVLWFVANRKDK